MPLYFDIGANNGKWGLTRAAESSSNLVFAFEPVPWLVKQINEGNPPSNYFLIPKAVSDVGGGALFNVCEGEAGCSSLLPLRDKTEMEAAGWTNRPDIAVKEVVEVEVIRLDDFIKAQVLEDIVEIDGIEFLHIDAQGSDLDVLKGLGKYIADVKKGECEAAIESATRIYETQTATVPVVREWLKAQGFATCVLPHGNFLEADIRFWRKTTT